MPNIQVINNFQCSLAEYYHKIKGGELFKFPAFDDCCPICEGKDCPRFLAVYYREVVDENGTYYKFFPILRFICKRKGFKKTKHRTFSLLPTPLVPYSKYSLPFVFKAIKEWKLNGKSVKEVLDELTLMEETGVLCVNPSNLYQFEKLLLTATEKILTTEFLLHTHSSLNIPNKDKRIGNFLGFFDERIRAPSAIAYRFYLHGGGYRKNAPFLFGTPSQFRF